MADDVSRWLLKSVEIGLADLTVTLAEFLAKNDLVSRLAFARPSTTTGEARSIFSPKNVANKLKPTAIVLTSDGTPTGEISGVVFKPDLP